MSTNTDYDFPTQIKKSKFLGEKLLVLWSNELLFLCTTFLLPASLVYVLPFFKIHSIVVFNFSPFYWSIFSTGECPEFCGIGLDIWIGSLANSSTCLSTWLWLHNLNELSLLLWMDTITGSRGSSPHNQYPMKETQDKHRAPVSLMNYVGWSFTWKITLRFPDCHLLVLVSEVLFCIKC